MYVFYVKVKDDWFYQENGSKKYSYLMCNQAMDQNSFRKVFRSAQCSTAQSQRLRAIEH
jgi:hypothetical protein